MNGSVFWKAGILTLIIFVIGMFFGMWLDLIRSEELRRNIEKIFIAWEDAKLQNLYYQIFPLDCELAVKQNLEFGDRVYLTVGKMLEDLEKVNKFAPELILEKEKYVLLKLQFWFNSIYLKNKCNATYVNVVYFYSHFTKDVVDQQEQNAQNLVLLELKEEYGNKMLLIPLPMDMNITVIEAIKSRFNITVAPTILINEEKVLEGLQPKEKLKEVIEQYLS